MAGEIGSFESTNFYNKLVNTEKNNDVFYGKKEIEYHSQNDEGFKEKILSESLLATLSQVWNDLDSDNEREVFKKLIQKYNGKLDSKFTYNIRGRQLLNDLTNQGLFNSFFGEYSRTINNVTNELYNLGGSILDSISDLPTDYFKNIEDIANRIKNADAGNMLKIIIDESAKSGYDFLEPGKKLKFLSIFLPKPFLNYLVNTTSQIKIRGKKIDPESFIDDMMGYIEDFEGFLEFVEVDTNKYVTLDVIKSKFNA